MLHDIIVANIDFKRNIYLSSIIIQGKKGGRVSDS